MNLDRLCACGCLTPLTSGVVFEVGALRYARGCVRMVFVLDDDEKIFTVSAGTVPEPVLSGPARAL